MRREHQTDAVTAVEQMEEVAVGVRVDRFGFVVGIDHLFHDDRRIAFFDLLFQFPRPDKELFGVGFGYAVGQLSFALILRDPARGIWLVQ